MTIMCAHREICVLLCDSLHMSSNDHSSKQSITITVTIILNVKLLLVEINRMWFGICARNLILSNTVTIIIIIISFAI